MKTLKRPLLLFNGERMPIALTANHPGGAEWRAGPKKRCVDVPCTTPGSPAVLAQRLEDKNELFMSNRRRGPGREPRQKPENHLLLWVSAALLCAAGPLWTVGGLISGLPGVITVTAALGTCLLGNLSAIVLSHQFRDPRHVMQQVLIGFMLRTGIPLFACMLAYLRVGMLAESGFVYYIMSFYFVALTVEIVLLACSKRDRPHQSKTG